ncbi:HAD family hydrolase [Gilvimarinus sp. DA14]|uniref:HAD family hydrolase n=1 Tax=Gilvimarinus sp. DA14 TaxID=2956798 RepID=UPI0020B8CC94|nr:HAD-IA family hydrolase [Gilvimarinus sp. DA14]UTF60765.1 HAD-IA family hydrolase [Gilvimarinus sp. DA14]
MNKSNYQAVMFDLDGTLLDTANDLASALNRLRIEKDLEPLDHASIRPSVSNGARALIELGFNEPTGSDNFEALRTRLLELYMLHIADHTQIFAGINELLKWLSEQNIGWGIATNKPALYTEALLKKIEFPSPPGIVICPDHVTHRKPDPESLLLAATHFNCAPNEIIYLGDHKRDIDCGKACGATTIACAYGYIEAHDDPASWQADHLINDSNELPELLPQLINA